MRAQWHADWAARRLIEHGEYRKGATIDELIVHPMVMQRRRKLVRNPREEYRNEPRFVVDENMNVTRSRIRSIVMIGDWS